MNVERAFDVKLKEAGPDARMRLHDRPYRGPRVGHRLWGWDVAAWLSRLGDAFDHPHHRVELPLIFAPHGATLEPVLDDSDRVTPRLRESV